MAAPLTGQVIVITGASSGIGRALSFALAPQRLKLVLAARDEERLNEVARECRTLGSAALVVRTDVTDAVQCNELIRQTVEHFGGLDVLVNNAGAVLWSRFDQIEDLTKIDDLMRLNYLGSVYCTHAALPHLKRSQGRIVAISSIAGLTGVPLLSVYAATKHAMFGFFESLRIELAPEGVTVTMIAPDFTQSEIFSRATGGSGRPLATLPIDVSKLMTTEALARKIVRAIERRQRLLLVSSRGKNLRWGKLLFPKLVDAITRRSMLGK